MEMNDYTMLQKEDGRCRFPVVDVRTGVERQCRNHAPTGFFCKTHNRKKNGSCHVFSEPFGNKTIDLTYCDRGHDKSPNSQICRMCRICNPSSEDD